eukprot:m.4562 g.4562  ORF g.4562 m.4562 type:complete len:93 (-) comp3928_c0_seq1:542-820(-)
MTITLYLSSISSDLALKKHMHYIEDILQGQGIEYEKIDVATQLGTLKEMRDKMGNDKAIVPQIFVDDKHVGGYDELFAAVEDEELKSFLNLA